MDGAPCHQPPRSSLVAAHPNLGLRQRRRVGVPGAQRAAAPVIVPVERGDDILAHRQRRHAETPTFVRYRFVCAFDTKFSDKRRLQLLTVVWGVHGLSRQDERMDQWTDEWTDELDQWTKRCRVKEAAALLHICGVGK